MTTSATQQQLTDNSAPESSGVVMPSLGTREYFHAELLRFRELMGQKSFWSDVERAGRAMYGLLYVWTNTDSPTQSDENHMQATCDEYDRRLAYAIVARRAA